MLTVPESQQDRDFMLIFCLPLYPLYPKMKFLYWTTLQYFGGSSDRLFSPRKVQQKNKNIAGENRNQQANSLDLEKPQDILSNNQRIWNHQSLCLLKWLHYALFFSRRKEIVHFCHPHSTTRHILTGSGWMKEEHFWPPCNMRFGLHKAGSWPCCLHDSCLQATWSKSGQ